MKNIDNKILGKVLRAYYEQGLTQQEIALRLGLSRIKVSRLISAALHDKIVQIKINIPLDPATEIEQKLENRYGLMEAIVVKKVSKDLLTDLGDACAEYLANRLQGNETIGLAWGRALLAMVNALPVLDFPNLQVVQTIGGLGHPDADTHGTDLAIRLAGTLHARARVLNSPGIVRTAELSQALWSERQITDTLALAENSSLAIFGIGTLNEASLLLQNNTDILTQVEAERLTKKGAVGDIGLRFFDKDGQLIVDEINDRVIGLKAASILKIPRRIGLAGGPDKATAIRAALRGGWVNILITDEQTANKLL